jgi:hypothetical protein
MLLWLSMHARASSRALWQRRNGSRRNSSTTTVITGLFYSGSPPHRAPQGGYDYLRQFAAGPGASTAPTPACTPVTGADGTTLGLLHARRQQFLLRPLPQPLPHRGARHDSCRRRWPSCTRPAGADPRTAPTTGRARRAGHLGDADSPLRPVVEPPPGVDQYVADAHQQPPGADKPPRRRSRAWA